MPVFIFLILDFVLEVFDVQVTSLLMFDSPLKLIAFLFDLLELLLLQSFVPCNTVQLSHDQVEASLQLLIIVGQLA
jgi:hypothetical protein